MNLTTVQTLVLDRIFRHLRGNEIQGRELVKETGITGKSKGTEGSDVRGIIHALRVLGYPICANSHGYYWASSEDELEAFTSNFQDRINDQQHACLGMRKNLEYLPVEIIEI